MMLSEVSQVKTGESLSFLFFTIGKDLVAYEIVPYMVSIRKKKMVKYSKNWKGEDKC